MFDTTYIGRSESCYAEQESAALVLDKCVWAETRLKLIAIADPKTNSKRAQKNMDFL